MRVHTSVIFTSGKHPVQILAATSHRAANEQLTHWLGNWAAAQSPGTRAWGFVGRVLEHLQRGHVGFAQDVYEEATGLRIYRDDPFLFGADGQDRSHEEQLDAAQAYREAGHSKYPTLPYEYGVINTLNWVDGVVTTPPMDYRTRPRPTPITEPV